MSEAGKIPNSGKPGPIVPSTKTQGSEPSPEAAPLNTAHQHKEQVIKENRVYQKPVEAQTTQTTRTESQQLGRNSKGLKIDQQVLARNPVLAAKLENRKNKSPNTEPRLKKSPPRLDPRLTHSREVLDSSIPLPKRLQGFKEKVSDNLERLQEALESGAELSLPQLERQLETSFKSPPLSALFDLDLSIVEQPLAEIVKLLESIIETYELEPILQEHLAQILFLLQAPNPELMKAFCLLFMPLPLPYDFAELDEDFERDEEEIRKDCDEEDRKRKRKRKKNTLNALTLPGDSAELSVSIRSLHYGKMHFLISQEGDELQMNIKTDAQADDLALSLELALDEMEQDRPDYAFHVWDNDVIRIQERRELRLRQRGLPSLALMNNLNTILTKIREFDAADIVETDYKIL